MKKFTAILLMCILLSLSLSSCSSIDTTSKLHTEKPLPSENSSEESKNPSKDSDSSFPSIFSKEAMERIEKIYSEANIGPQTVTTVHQLAILTSVCAFLEGKGPITVTPATLNGEDITLITLGGTQMVKGQATSMKESALASQGKQNDYLSAVEKLIENGTVPPDTPIVVAGISLGGMIAQQLVGKTELLQRHGIEIRKVICFGSPFTYPEERNGVSVVRFTDENDPVPKMGENALLGGMLGKLPPEKKEAIEKRNMEEKLFGEGKYKGFEAHGLSYIGEDCWNQYDFMGSENKENVLVLKKELTFYAAPKLEKEG